METINDLLTVSTYKLTSHRLVRVVQKKMKCLYVLKAKPNISVNIRLLQSSTLGVKDDRFSNYWQVVGINSVLNADHFKL